jgi:hypothetical protein
MASPIFRITACTVSLAAVSALAQQPGAAPAASYPPVITNPGSGYSAPPPSYGPSAGYQNSQPAYPAAPPPAAAPGIATYPTAPPSYPAASAPYGTTPANPQPPTAAPATGYSPQGVYAPQGGAPPTGNSYAPASYTPPSQAPALPPGGYPAPAFTPTDTTQPLATPGAGNGSVRSFEPAGDGSHQHEDTRHGHDQVYPDRGTLVRELPRGASVLNFAGSSYWFCEGVWFEPRGAAFVVIAPPIGLLVPTLPTFATAIVSAGHALLYANDTYYRPRPELGGYEVVNDPEEPTVDNAATARARAEPPPPLAAAAAVQVSNAVAPTTALPPAEAVGPPGGTISSPYPYPRNAQSADQLARDRYDCYRFAVSQTGYDPLRAPASAANAARQGDYERAQSACFEGRGYTVRE